MSQERLDRTSDIERDALVEALKRQNTYPANDRVRLAECIRLALLDQGFEIVHVDQRVGAVARLDAIRSYVPLMDSESDAASIRAILDVDVRAITAGGSRP